mgnify:CR=1 FL=1|jgi:hypothetical protein|tara:strand:- start:99 stop:1559 length:1461 start_codon:yes stop_codon:yes gene_type:complete
MGTDKYDYKETKESLWQIAKRYRETKLDDNFQRRGGVERGSGWTEPQSMKYMECLSDGFVSNKIMVAEVEGCLRHAISEGDEESTVYFKDLAKDGYTYVSIDGNNSSSTINAYLSDEFTIYPYLEASTRGRGKKKKKFSELTVTEQNDLQHTEKLTYYVFRKIGIIEMCDLFRYENTSTKLNGQEYRQARWSELSKFIRNVANSPQGKAIFKNLMCMPNSEMDKRKHEEITSQFSMRVESNYTTSTFKGELDNFYENNERLTSQSEDIILKAFNIVYKLSTSLDGTLKTSAKFHLSDMTSLFDMVYYLLTSRRDIFISDERAFFNWFVGALFCFREESKKVLEENQEEESYTFWAIRPTKLNYNNKMRNAFINKLIEDEQDLMSRCVLSKRRTSRDSFSMEQACSLFDLQEGKLRDGSDIDFLDVMTAGKLEVDHVTSVRDGGTTELSNGELMSTSDNRSKGGKSNSPHFKHQSDDWDGTIFIGGE